MIWLLELHRLHSQENLRAAAVTHQASMQTTAYAMVTTARDWFNGSSVDMTSIGEDMITTSGYEASTASSSDSNIPDVVNERIVEVSTTYRYYRHF